jgi:TonB family protein
MQAYRISFASILTALSLITAAAQAEAMTSQKPSDGRDESKKTLPSYLRDGPQPIERTVKVQFISNGYSLNPEHCQLEETSGDKEADRQACSTVQFYKTGKGQIGVASTKVWLVPPINGSFVGPHLSNKQPPITAGDYPVSSLRRGAQGTVTMRLLVDTLGKASDCTVMISAGDEDLDTTACRKFISRARYEPATLDGKPVDSYTYELVQFYQGNGSRESD